MLSRSKAENAKPDRYTFSFEKLLNDSPKSCTECSYRSLKRLQHLQNKQIAINILRQASLVSKDKIIGMFKIFRCGVLVSGKP